MEHCWAFVTTRTTNTMENLLNFSNCHFFFPCVNSLFALNQGLILIFIIPFFYLLLGPSCCLRFERNLYIFVVPKMMQDKRLCPHGSGDLTIGMYFPPLMNCVWKDAELFSF